MDLSKIKHYINDAVLAIFGIIDVLLILRLMLKMIAARTESSFVELVYNSSSQFVEVFEGTMGNIEAGQFSLEVDTLIAIFVYFAVGLGLFKFLEAAFEKVSQEKFRLALDTLFKVGEVTLGMRLFFKLVGAGESDFINILYTVSDVFYKPFEGLLPSADADQFVFETSTLIAIIILIVLDVATENLFKEIRKKHASKEEELDNIIDEKKKDQKLKNFVTPKVAKPQMPQRPSSTAEETNSVKKTKTQSNKGQVAQILDQKSGQAAIMEIDNLLSPIFYKNPNLLTRAERNIVLIEELEREVNNGGFKQFFRNSSGGTAHETLAALSSIGSREFTKLLKEAVSQFPNDVVPKVNETRQKIISEIEEMAEPTWTKLDAEFYKYEEDLYGLMIDYIKENIGNFR